MKLTIGVHQLVNAEHPISPTRIGKNPYSGADKGSWLAAPSDIALPAKCRIGCLTEESDEAWRMTRNLSLRIGQRPRRSHLAITGSPAPSAAPPPSLGWSVRFLEVLSPKLLFRYRPVRTSIGCVPEWFGTGKQAGKPGSLWLRQLPAPREHPWMKQHDGPGR